MSNFLRIQVHSPTTLLQQQGSLSGVFAPRKPFHPQRILLSIFKNQQKNILLPFRHPGETCRNSVTTRVFPYFKIKDCQTQGNFKFCCQLMTPEITLNTNQVKVSANKNIYLQNIKTDNIVTSIYKDTHDSKEIKLCLIYLLQYQFLRPFLHKQYTNHQCLANAICQRHKPSIIGNLMQLSTKLA